MRRGLAVILALLFVLLGVYLARQRPSTAPTVSADTSQSPGSRNRKILVGANAHPDQNRAISPTSAAAASSPAATSQPGAARAMSPDDIRRVIAENSVPGRMVFLDFTLDRTGLRLVGATGAAGRAKPGGTRPGFGFVHYEVFGASGDLLLTGSVEDPTRRRIEHPASTDDGRITSTVQFSDEGPLAVRLPGEVGAARIVFFRDKNPAAGGTQGREPLGEFALRPQP